MQASELLQNLSVLNLCTVSAAGSRVTNVPPPSDGDYDFLVELPNEEVDPARAYVEGVGAVSMYTNVLFILLEEGFVHEGGGSYNILPDSGFQSWRRGSINILLTADHQWAEKHRVATALCKRLNLPNKADRIAVFTAVLYGQTYSG